MEQFPSTSHIRITLNDTTRMNKFARNKSGRDSSRAPPPRHAASRLEKFRRFVAHNAAKLCARCLRIVGSLLFSPRGFILNCLFNRRRNAFWMRIFIVQLPRWCIGTIAAADSPGSLSQSIPMRTSLWLRAICVAWNSRKLLNDSSFKRYDTS